MNSKLLLALVFSTLLMPITSFAQTSGLIPIDNKHMGEISIDNVRVVERDYYKVIYTNVHVKVENLALEDGTILEGEIILQNNNGKIYGPELQDCNVHFQDFSGTANYTILGSEGGIKTYTLCYEVEKEFNHFTVYVLKSYPTYHQIQIGTIDLNQNPLTNANSYAQNINMTQPKDFFTRLVDWFKSLFHFS